MPTNSSRETLELLKALIVLVVNDDRCTGYEVVSSLKSLAEDIQSRGEGTYYPLLYKLERMGVLEKQRKTIDGRKRFLYSCPDSTPDPLDQVLSSKTK